MSHPAMARDITGQRFGYLTVVSRAESRRNEKGYAVWVCLCDCGKTREVDTHALRCGCGSCGCRTTFVDHTGERFGRLTALRVAGKRNWYVSWLCRCDCGNECEVSSRQLRTGDTKSCGCLRRESARERLRENRERRSA